MTPDQPGGSTSDTDRRIALAHEWDELVAQVRELPGFAEFLRPPRLETLLPAAADGPVVILNVSRWRCDALVVRMTGVTVVELDGLTQDDVVANVNEYLNAVGAYQGEGARDAKAPAAGSPIEAQLDRCLTWMWDSFAERVLDSLGYTGPPADGTWPRVWWCPTGALTLLPIHAAGDHRTPGKAVLDRVVSSYTPTLRALLEARGGERAGERAARMLFVGMPRTPHQPDLPNVAVEEQLLERVLPGARYTPLIGADATRDAVLRELPGHAWVHFACHGDQNLGDPSRGGVHVQDGVLTVTDFSARQYHGEFAYLSGCKTAVGGVDLPDEAVTLAAALHYTGYRHVIATLWSVYDQHAAQVAESVYAQLVHDGDLDPDRSAYALHRAVAELRDGNRDRPSVWTPFAHTGP